MAPSGDKNKLSPLSPRYDGLDPAFFTDIPYSPGDGSGEAASDCFAQAVSTAYPISTLTSPDWPVLDTFSPLGSVSYFPVGGYMSSSMAVETDSESDPFSPIDACPGLDPLTGQWSWSQPSSPSMGPDSTPSSTQATSATATRQSKSSKSSKSSKPKAQAKLRTASRKPRKSAASSRSTGSPSEGDVNDDAITPEELRARRNHNLVEKQYRNRLNAQFERLLAVLPADQRGGQGGEDDKRMSKAEVLDVATRRIKELELERRRLQKERRDLLQNMEMMNGVVGGVPRR